MTDDELLEGFESGRLPNEAFHHREHVRVARLCLQREDPFAAAERFSSGLKRFAAAHGKAGLYHETITSFYLFLIHERMAREDPHEPWDEFERRNPDLLEYRPGLLPRYYRKETLASPLARRVFLLPDRLGEP